MRESATRWFDLSLNSPHPSSSCTTTTTTRPPHQHTTHGDRHRERQRKKRERERDKDTDRQRKKRRQQNSDIFRAAGINTEILFGRTVWETLLSIVDWVYSKTQILLDTLKTLNQPWREGENLVYLRKSNIRSKKWMRKKQTSVSQSSTESEVISFDAGLRMDGIPTLALWDLVVEVLHFPTTFQ